MVRLNKTPLEEKQVDRLFLQLATLLSPQLHIHINDVLTELLGREEKIMIAKRLAVIVLISEGFSAYKISNILKLSESTVSGIVHRITQGDYKTIENALGKNRKSYFNILSAIDTILHLGGTLPHYNGLDRYRGL